MFPSHKILRERYLKFNERQESKNLDLHFDDFSLQTSDGKYLIKNSELKIVRNKRYGLVARNGLGKSTLLHQISSYQIGGFPKHLSVIHVVQKLSAPEVSVLLGYCNSNIEIPFLLEEEERVGKLIDKCKETELDKLDNLNNVLNHINGRREELQVWNSEKEAKKILLGLGFTEDQMEQKVSSLSGGWQMRAYLACGLFLHPDILLLDEPTNHLDYVALDWLTTYLSNSKMTSIIVSHDRAFLNNVTTEIILLKNLQLRYFKGNYDAFQKVVSLEKAWAAKETHELKKKRLEVGKFMARLSKSGSKLKSDKSNLSDSLSTLEEKPFTFRFLPFDMPRNDSYLISCNKLDHSFDEKHELLKKVSFRVGFKDNLAIMGKNGAGKSTLLKLLMKKLEPSFGELDINPDVEVGYFSQHHQEQLDLDRVLWKCLKESASSKFMIIWERLKFPRSELVKKLPPCLVEKRLDWRLASCLGQGRPLSSGRTHESLGYGEYRIFNFGFEGF